MTRAWGKSKKSAGSQRYEGKVEGAGRRPAVPKTGSTAGEKNSVAGCAEYFRLLLRAAWGTGRNACATESNGAEQVKNAGWKPALQGKTQRRRLEASGTREESKAPAGSQRYERKVKGAGWKPALRGKSQRRRLEASGTREESKKPAGSQRYEGRVKDAGRRPAVQRQKRPSKSLRSPRHTRRDARSAKDLSYMESHCD
jgi:hypothetical protein